MKFKRQELFCEYIHLGNGQKVRKGSGVFDGGNKKSALKGGMKNLAPKPQNGVGKEKMLEFQIYILFPLAYFLTIPLGNGQKER